MKKIKIFILLIVALLMLTSIVMAGCPKNYLLVHEHRDGNQNLMMTQKYYYLGGNKLRIDTAAVDSAEIINIYRLDKKVLWTLYMDAKQYTESPLDKKTWDLVQNAIANLVQEYGKKVGEDTYKGYPCNIYEIAEKEEKSLAYVSKTNDLVLKIQHQVGARVTYQVDTVELSLVKPNAALFELPKDFKKIQSE